MSSAVREMFDDIAPTYDALNRVLSLGIDQRWRARAVAKLGPVEGRPVVDLCAGTLDLSRLAQRAGARVVAVDFARAMLTSGRGKVAAQLLCADAAALPLADGLFAGALCGFGLRNLDDPGAGLREARRVLAPGARLVVLDFFRPARPFSRVVQALYNRRVLPLVGGLVSGERDAYRYLARSIECFRSVAEVRELALAAGFARVRAQDLTGGIASLLVAE